MKKSALREHVIRNYRRHLGQFQPKNSQARVFQKLTPEMVFDLLENASGLCQGKEKELLKKMSAALWTITSAPKEGGFDPNDELHFSLDVPINNRKPAYHCYCRELPRGLFVYRITQTKPDSP